MREFLVSEGVNIKRDLHFLSAILAKYEVTNRCFKINDDITLDLNLEDVMYMTGLRVDGELVVGVD